MQNSYRFLRRINCTAVIVAMLASYATAAQSDPLENGWSLNADASSLHFQSIKNNSKVETSTFSSFDGMIEPDGTATIQIKLESVDTKVDLRNVRMRFLFFQAFQYPLATIKAKLDPEFLSKLEEARRLPLDLEFTLDLHGVTKQITAPVMVTLVSDDMVSVASKEPVTILAKDFDLEEGIARLEDAAKVSIVPSSSVSFDFEFKRIGGAKKPVAVVEAAPEEEPAQVQADATLSREACLGRFEILSRSGSVNFESGSAVLDGNSGPMLASVADIVNRCPGLNITVAGHTDSSGNDAFNQKLSEERAKSVSQYLVTIGISETRINAVGYGETQPVADNDTAWNRSLNRRIEFRVNDDG